MNPVRSIAVHLDGSPRAALRLRIARELARRHDAEITAVLGVAPAFSDLPLAYGAGADAARIIEKLDEDRRLRARSLFEDECDRPGPQLRWAELEGLSPIDGFVQHGLLADLLVLGQHDANDRLAFGVPPDFVESVIAGSGRPALVVPSVGEFTGVDGTALIAWKPTRESVRAVVGALPLLRCARQIHVLRALEDEDVGRPVPSAALPTLDRFLRSHGVLAPIESHGGLRAQVGETLLSLAADLGADLLVMGCYGHSRTREWLLGGATRTVLRSMTLPVLMAH